MGLALAGCAVGPDYRAPGPDVPAAWSRVESEAGITNEGARSEPGSAAVGLRSDLSQWWSVLNDALLSELVEKAQQQSLDLRKARARLREARARLAVAGAARYPELEATGSASRSESRVGADLAGSQSASVEDNQFSAGFDASWELDVFGGVRRGVEAAAADQQSAEASLEDVRVSLVAEVARNYVDVRSLEIRLGIARANLASQTETLRLTEFRAQAGLVSAQDVEQARTNREQTQAQVPALEIDLATAEHRLDILLGSAPGTLHARLAAGGSLPEVPSRIAVGIPADTLRRRPDVRAAERTLAAETARVAVAEAARYPSFQLSGSIAAEALVEGATGNSAGAAYSLLGAVTAPIFDAGRRKAQVEGQDAVREEAELAYRQAVLTALQDVEDALVELARNRERGRSLSHAAESARSAAQLARQRYAAGVIDFQSVIDTERTALAVEDTLATTRADEVLALIRLYKALGGGWSGEAGEPMPGTKSEGTS